MYLCMSMCICIMYGCMYVSCMSICIMYRCIYVSCMSTWCIYDRCIYVSCMSTWCIYDRCVYVSCMCICIICITYRCIYVCLCVYVSCIDVSMYHVCLYVQPIPLGVTFSKAQSSKLERLFCHVSVKRDVPALSVESWNSIRKCHPKWDWLYHVYLWQMDLCIYVCLYVSCIDVSMYVYMIYLWQMYLCIMYVYMYHV